MLLRFSPVPPQRAQLRTHYVRCLKERGEDRGFFQKIKGHHANNTRTIGVFNTKLLMFEQFLSRVLLFCTRVTPLYTRVSAFCTRLCFSCCFTLSLSKLLKRKRNIAIRTRKDEKSCTRVVDDNYSYTRVFLLERLANARIKTHIAFNKINKLASKMSCTRVFALFSASSPFLRRIHA